jgi:WD40 repeat protein
VFLSARMRNILLLGRLDNTIHTIISRKVLTFTSLAQTGYNPRVLVFSMAKDASPDMPLAILTEHTFGIKCVAFSPDSRYLASLGSMNDGFLYIWAINPKNGSARLHSSNKCTSNVRHIAWMGRSLVSYGTRSLKCTYMT